MNASMNRSNALVESHLALVGYSVNEVIARVPSHVSRSDLMSAGAMALVRAARSFDETKGVPFARYASMRIRGALVDELRSMDWVSRGSRRRVRATAEVADTLTSRLRRTPTTDEIAQAMGVSVREVHTAQADGETRVLSMDAYEGALSAGLVDASVGPLDALVSAERMEYLRAGVECLPDKLAFVVEQLFFHDRPVADLAEEMGLTRSRISQLRSEAFVQVRLPGAESGSSPSGSP